MHNILKFLAMGSMLFICSSSPLSSSESTIAEGSAATTVDSMIFPFNTMTDEESTSTGAKKLSPNEQKSFLEWVRGRDMTLNPPSHTTVSEIQEKGKIIVLANGQSFSCKAKKKVAQWKEKTDIEIYETTKSGAFVLKNMATGDMVKVKLITSSPSPKK